MYLLKLSGTIYAPAITRVKDGVYTPTQVYIIYIIDRVETLLSGISFNALISATSLPWDLDMGLKRLD